MTAEPRRFLIATAVADYSNAPHWNLPGLLDARAELIALFTERLGYQHVSDLGMNPTKGQLAKQLRSFCRSPDRRPDDIIAVYLAGHGEILDENNEHVFLTADTDPDDTADALPTVEIARKMLLGTPVRRVLLMLDTCYSGRGGNDLTAAALTGMTSSWGDHMGSGLVVITSAQPAEQARTGAFPQLLREAVEGLPAAGYTPEVLPLDFVLSAMNTNTAKPAFQTIGSTLAQLTGEIPPFLPNPRHDPTMTEVDLAIQRTTKWEAQAERRDVEFTTRLLVRAMGGHETAQGWWFAGRHAALRDITTWLTNPRPDSPLLAVTAAPGSGKTAVLGLVASLTHPNRRGTVPLDTLGLPPDAVPPPSAVDVAIYAQKLTTDDVMAGITAAAKISAETISDLLRMLTFTGRPTPLTVLIDALDEAANPDDLTRRLLRPLAEHANGRIRLLVGTRPHLLTNLGLDRATSIDLDAPQYADLPAMTTYAARGLLDANPNSPYRRQQPSVIRAVAHAVAAAANPSFLVARIVSQTLAAEHTVPDPTDATWLARLPRLPSEAMRRDLDTRLGADTTKVRDLLRPLAFAEGQGLPWEDIWAPLASRIAGATYTDDDLLWLRDHAGSYVVEATESDRSAYRLYHQSLAELLREDVNEPSIHLAFTEVLRSRLPRTADYAPDWTRAHPYTRHHLSTHAARCGELDALIADPDYLVTAEPTQLLTAMGGTGVTTENGRIIRAIYGTSFGSHRRLSAERRRQFLAINAARFAAPEISYALAKPLTWKPRWAVEIPAGIGGMHANRSTRLKALETERAKRSLPMDNHDYYSKITGIAAPAHKNGNGQHVVILSYDGKMQIRELVTGGLCEELANGARALANSVIADVPVVVTAGRGISVHVWEVATNSQRASLTSNQGQIDAVACCFVAGTPIAVTGGYNRTIQVWDLTTNSLLATLAGHKSSVTTVACTVVDNVPVAIAGGNNKTVRMWNLATHSPFATLEHDNWVNSVACTTIDNVPVAVTSGYNNAVRVWDLTTNSLRAILTGHEKWVRAVTCAVIDGIPAAVTASDDETVRVWDLRTNTELAKIDLPGIVGTTLCIGPKQEIIVGAGWGLIVFDRQYR